MPKVRTVLGDIEASELGFTMAHEHVIHCPRGLFAPDNEWALRDFNIQLQMVKGAWLTPCAVIRMAAAPHI